MIEGLIIIMILFCLILFLIFWLIADIATRLKEIEEKCDEISRDISMNDRYLNHSLLGYFSMVCEILDKMRETNKNQKRKEKKDERDKV